MSTELGSNVVQEVKSTLSKAKAILDKKEKGLPEEAKRLYTLACSSVEEALQKEPKSNVLLLLLSKTYFERAQAAKTFKTEDSKQYEKFIQKSLKKVEKATQLKEKDEDGHILWSRILIHLAEYTPSLHENEEYMMMAAEKLIKITEFITNPHKVVYDLLERTVEVLVNGTKERERTGKAVYHIAGEFMKQGGGKKSLNWKVRWFVVTDTSIAYYKEKKDWDIGPVQGFPAQPQGTVEFSDITDIASHPDFLCPTEKKPKNMDKTFCLHVVTGNRTYNLIGFETKELTAKWISVLWFALRCYNAKRSAKKLLRETSKSDLRGFGDDIYPPQVPK